MTTERQDPYSDLRPYQTQGITHLDRAIGGDFRGHQSIQSFPQLMHEGNILISPDVKGVHISGVTFVSEYATTAGENEQTKEEALKGYDVKVGGRYSIEQFRSMLNAVCTEEASPYIFVYPVTKDDLARLEVARTDNPAFELQYVVGCSQDFGNSLDLSPEIHNACRLKA